MKLSEGILGDTGALRLPQFTFQDERGVFSHLFRMQDNTFEQNIDFRQLRNIYSSFNPINGTFRGYHKQASPHGEGKVLSCVSGAALHIVLKVFKSKLSFDTNILSSYDGNATFIPRDCYSGFITLEPNSSLIYLTDSDYTPASSLGIRWNDPILAEVELPNEPVSISPKDLGYPDFFA